MPQRKKHTVQPEISESPKKPAGKPNNIETPLLSEQESLRANEDKFKYMFEHSIVGKSFTLPSGEINVNQALCDMLGYSLEELSHKFWQEITYPEDIELTKSMMDKLLSGEQDSVRFTKKFLHKNGDVIWTDVSTCLRRDEAGQPLYFMTEVNDITERKQIEEVFNRFFEQPMGLNLIAKLDGVIHRANKGLEDLLGYGRGCLVGVNFLDFVHPDDQAATIAEMGKLAQGINTFYFENRYRQKNGEYRLLTWSAAAGASSPDQMILAVAIDITERKQAETALRKSEAKFCRLFQNNRAILGLSVLKDSRYIDVNEEFLAVSGYSREDVIGKTALELGIWADPKDRSLLVDELRKNKRVRDLELQIRTKSGEVRMLLCNVERIDFEGEPCILLSAIDITARKRAEEALEESVLDLEKRNNFINTILENLAFGLSVHFIDSGVTKYMNPAYSRVYGWPAEDMKDVESFFKLIYPDPVYSAQQMKMVMEDIDSGDPERLHWEGFMITTKTGEERFIEARNIPLPDQNLMISTAWDITERKQAEDKLYESEERFRSLYENATIGMYRTSPDGKILMANPSLLKLLGYQTFEELTKLDLNREGFEPDYLRQEYQQQVEKEGEIHGHEAAWKKKDGSIVLVRESAWVGRDKNGKELYYEGTVEDITERKQVEQFIQNIISKNPISIQVLDKEGVTLETNPAYKLLFGSVPPTDYSIFNDLQLAQKGMGVIFDQLRNGELVHFPDVNINPHDSVSELPDVPVWVRTTGFPISDRSEKEQRFVLMHENITERKISAEKLQKTLVGTIHTIALIVETRDPYTSGHQKRVANISVAIAKELDLPEDQIQGIYFSSLVHDVGKIQVPSEILSKPGKLNKFEFELIKTHSEVGYELMKEIEFPWPIAEIVYQHHERVNGSGYPRKLKGRRILIEAKIIGLADVIEAMSSHRPYRSALGLEAALDEINKNKGILFDPDIVEASIKAIKKDRTLISSP